jgi:hypothetical protein
VSLHSVFWDVALEQTVVTLLQGESVIPNDPGHVELLVERAIQPISAVEAVFVSFSDFNRIVRHRLAFLALERVALRTYFDCMRE